MTITTTETLDMTYAAILDRAADAIEKRGKAHEDYVQPIEGIDRSEWPVDVQGALAVACGFAPDTWDSETADSAAFRPAREVADLLVDALGLDEVVAWDESIGRWSDDNAAEQVVAKLRKIAKEVQTS